MKKIISQSLLLVMCTGLVAFAVEAPPGINLGGLEDILNQPAGGQQQQQANPAAGQQANPAAGQQANPAAGQQAGQQAGQNFNLGGITNTGSSQSNPQGQAVNPIFIAPGAGQGFQQQGFQQQGFPQQGFQQRGLANSFQANLGARSLAGPPQVAATGPGMLAGLIPVAAYSLIAFRRKQN